MTEQINKQEQEKEQQKQEQDKEQEINVSQAWNVGLKSWNNPTIPRVISIESQEARESLGELGRVLEDQIAFMKYPEFQTYENLERILSEFPENRQRALIAVNKHEVSHRFCPYDTLTSIILLQEALKGLKGKSKSRNEKESAGIILNLFTDMNGNTNLSRRGDEDIVWLYQLLSNQHLQYTSLGRVYARSMELSWKKKILPESAKLSQEEQEAAEEISKIYEGDYFNRTKWRDNIRQYAYILSDFVDKEEPDSDKKKKSTQQEENHSSSGSGKGLIKRLKDKLQGKGNQEFEKAGENEESGISKNGSKPDKVIYGPDNIAKNIPETIDDKTAQEIAKHLAEIGSNGLPTNPKALEDFKDLMAGFGRGDPKKASLEFYEMLSRAYDVIFSTQPFGRPRLNPFQPIKWTPEMPIERLDIDYSVSVSSRIIPGVTTYTWNSRKRESKGGIEEIVPDLDVFLDTSLSTDNPLEKISLGALASIVLVKKAHRKGAKVRGTNFSGKGQHSTVGFTRDLKPVLENFMVYYGGGTILPVKKLLELEGPKQVVIITDTYLANKEDSANAIRELRDKDKRNKVTIYAVSPQIDREYLEQAGAEVIQDTTTNIFKRAIGKANEVYGK